MTCLRSAASHLAALGALAVSLEAANVAPPAQVLPAQAVVRFAGTSTLHDFGGQLSAEPFSLILSNGTWSASADVLAEQMATANKKRDRKMHQMLAINLFPKIHGIVAGAPVPGPTGTNVTLSLKIRKKTLDLPVRITAWKETPHEIMFHAHWELSLKAFGLKPPSVIGLIRVGDQVNLEADVSAAKTTVVPPTPNPAP